MILSPEVRSGCEEIPNFSGEGTTVGHIGDGAARITGFFEFLFQCKVSFKPFAFSLTNPFYLLILTLASYKA
jgi:hypothetical protein